MSKQTGRTSAKYALKYFTAITPVKFKSKKATLKNWPKTLVTKENYQKYFNQKPSNVAVLNGQGSCPLIDVDCDDDNFAYLWQHAGIPTQLSFGREGSIPTHYFYKISDEIPETKKYLNEERQCIVELRSKQTCTLVPPSVHENGDNVVFYKKGAPGITASSELIECMTLCFILTLLTDFYPNKGGRHDFCLTVSGLLANAGYPYQIAQKAFSAFVEYAGDKEIEDRIRCLKDAYQRVSEGKRAQGIGKLQEYDLSAKTLQLISHYTEADNASKVEKVIDDLNKEYALINIKGAIKILQETYDYETGFKECQFLDERGFKLLYKNKIETVGRKSSGKPIQKTYAEIWLSHTNRRKYKDFVFIPGKEVPADIYNIWQGFSTVPDRTKSCKLFLKHTLDIICSGNKEHFLWLINLLAFIVQYPHLRTEVALALRGSQGAGKSIFFEYMRKIWGPHYMTISQPEHITGKFNAHLANKVMLLVEEGFWAGDKKAKGTLKDLVTNPRINIERKGFDTQSANNYLNIFFTSNESHVVPIELGERRFAVLDVSDSRKGDSDYFNALIKERDNGGVEALLYKLLNHSVDKQLIRKLPQTKASEEQFLYGLDSEGQFIFEALKRGTFSPNSKEWRAEIRTVELFELYQKGFKGRDSTVTRASETTFGIGLNKYINGAFKKKRKSLAIRTEVEGKKCNSPFKRPQLVYIFQNLETCRKIFEEKIGREIDWKH